MGQGRAVVLHYHGSPITPLHRLLDPTDGLQGRCFCVSFAAPEQIELLHEIGQSVMLDNGAYSIWRLAQEGKPIPSRLRRAAEGDWSDYYTWVEPWLDYRTTWAVVPDVIGGTEAENDALVADWPYGVYRGAPVWHLHESLHRLRRLCLCWPRVCVGSSGQYADPTSDRWRHRMEDAFNAICPNQGPPTWLHMLRAMDQAAGGPFPFASCDSSNLAQNHAGNNGGRPRKSLRAMADAIDARQAPARWRTVERTMELSA